MKTGLLAIADIDAAVIILGTFPGEESLATQHYYAHQRNLFWDMMEEICGAGRQHPYEIRCQILRKNRIAVWDVIQACEREGSADSRIKRAVANDFSAFFAAHQCRTLFFNGKMASALFARHVDPCCFESSALFALPSTSPANAGMTRNEKTGLWLKITEFM